MSVTLNGTDGLVFNDGTSQKSASYTGFRNRIINGDMRIDQRNAGASVTTNTSFAVDRFQLNFSNDGACSLQQSSTAPSGFTNSIVFTTTTADASLGSTQYTVVTQRIEGHNVSDLGFGTSGASSVALSFWVRSSLTGTFGGSLQNNNSDRNYPFVYEISSANTWEKKTISIAGDTSGTWLTNNGVGIQLHFGLGSGSSYSGTAGSWTSSNVHTATGAVSVIGTLNATWYITGVQLEAGSTATEFEKRPFGLELSLCERYYEKSYRLAVTPGTNVGSTANLCFMPPGSNLRYFVFFRTRKRSDPSILTFYSNAGTADRLTNQSTGGEITSAATHATETWAQFSTNAATAGNEYCGQWVAGAEL